MISTTAAAISRLSFLSISSAAWALCRSNCSIAVRYASRTASPRDSWSCLFCCSVVFPDSCNGTSVCVAVLGFAWIVAMITASRAHWRTGICDSYRHSRPFQQAGIANVALFWNSRRLRARPRLPPRAPWKQKEPAFSPARATTDRIGAGCSRGIGVKRRSPPFAKAAKDEAPTCGNCENALTIPGEWEWLDPRPMASPPERRS